MTQHLAVRSCKWLLICMSLILTSCTSVVDSDIHAYTEDGRSCDRDSLGAYHLPRRLVSLTITEHKISGRKVASLKLDEKLKVAADTSETYCLNFLGSLTAKDDVGVQYDRYGLLARVYTKAEDKSREIAIKAIEAAGQAAASLLARSTQIAATENIKAQYVFDPFNKREAAAVNQGLRHFGYCIYIDDRNDEYAPAWSRTQCGQPPLRRYSQTPPVTHVTPSGWTSKKKKGIYYRPFITHKLVVLQRDDPTSGDPWHLDKVKYLEMPNNAPVFTIGVDRAMFTDRTTDLTFDSGVLVDVVMTKGSELENFADIPLAAAKVIAEIPTRAINIQIDSVTNRQRLIEANAALLQTLREHDKARTDAENAAKARAQEDEEARKKNQTQNNTTRSADLPTSRPASFSQCLAECQTTDGEAQCNSYCSCKVNVCAGSGDAESCNAFCLQRSRTVQ